MNCRNRVVFDHDRYAIRAAPVDVIRVGSKIGSKWRAVLKSPES
jgi:hypothetical protein